MLFDLIGKNIHRILDPVLEAWKLVPTDKTPKEKREDKSLREKVKKIQKDLDDGILNILVKIDLSIRFGGYFTILF